VLFLNLAELQNPRAQKSEHTEGSLCRCGTYSRIVEAVQKAAANLRGGKA
jgi:aerobic-type carbon monoxide dehydrogenase small subunit (CoxS/CutS family)